MNMLLKPLVTNKPPSEQVTDLPTHCKDPVGFTWWMVTHLAMIGQYSHNGMIQNGVREQFLRFAQTALDKTWTPIMQCNQKKEISQEERSDVRELTIIYFIFHFIFHQILEVIHYSCD